MLGPVAPVDLAKSVKDDDLPNEGELSPTEGDKAGDLVWKTAKSKASKEKERPSP